MKVANMTSNLADLLSSVNEAERRLRATVPRTPAWLDAQRLTVNARADFWDKMGEEWDRNHTMLTDFPRTD